MTEILQMLPRKDKTPPVFPPNRIIPEGGVSRAKTHTTAMLAKQLLADRFPRATVNGDLLIVPFDTPAGQRTLEIDCASNGAYVFEVDDPAVAIAYRKAIVAGEEDVDAQLAEAEATYHEESETFLATCHQQREIAGRVIALVAALESIIWCDSPRYRSKTEQAMQLSLAAQSVEELLKRAMHYHYGGDGVTAETLTAVDLERCRERAEEAVSGVRIDRHRDALALASRWLERHLSVTVSNVLRDKYAFGPNKHLAEGVIKDVIAAFHGVAPAEQVVDSYRRALRTRSVALEVVR